MSFSLKNALGAFRILGRRSREIGQPGLGVWTFAGERAVQQVNSEVCSLAYKNEATEADAAARLKGMLADGRIDPTERAELQRISATLNRCADREHKISEAVKL